MPDTTRKKRKSRLDKHAVFLLRGWNKNVSMNSLRAELEKKGCKVSFETVRKWLMRKEVAGYLPSRPSTKRGRPSGSGGSSTVSLGFLPATLPSAPSEIPVPTALYLMATKAWLSAVHVSGLEELGVPLNEDLEPDFQKWAANLGRRRVQTFGDMDYYFLSLFTNDVRDIVLSNKDEDYQRVLFTACQIRQKMRAAVGL